MDGISSVINVINYTVKFRAIKALTNDKGYNKIKTLTLTLVHLATAIDSNIYY